VNWTEILLKGRVPDAPGYQELVAAIRKEQAALRRDGDSVQQVKKRKGKRKSPRR
jgi:hypothetical protein